MTQHKVGDTVHIAPHDSQRFAGTYKVTKINPTTYRLTSDAVPNLKAPHHMVQAGPLENGTTSSPAAVQMVPILNLHPGAVVRFTHARTIDESKLFVVCGLVSRGYRLYPLGGSHRYYTNVPASSLAEVTEITGWTKD